MASQIVAMQIWIDIPIDTSKYTPSGAELYKKIPCHGLANVVVSGISVVISERVLASRYVLRGARSRRWTNELVRLFLVRDRMLGKIIRLLCMTWEFVWHIPIEIVVRIVLFVCRFSIR